MRKYLCFLFFVLMFNSYAKDNSSIEVLTIEGQTPLSSPKIEKNTLNSDLLSVERQLNVTQSLTKYLPGFNQNDVQNNPYQVDINYRGYTLSPLLGMPQGMAVYLNGTRFNEPFGDTVNWDLIPTSALQIVTLVEGSNPIFGQNALGGALILNSKTGFDSVPNAAHLHFAQYDRFQANVELSDEIDDKGYYLNMSHFKEDGWRDHSKSQLSQFFSTISLQGDEAVTHVTLALNNGDLTGNGAIPIELIEAQGREAVFTQPDNTKTQLAFLNVNSHWSLSQDTDIRINAYLRTNRIDTFNGDDSDYEACETPYGKTLCEEDDMDEDSDESEEHEENDEQEHETPVQFVGYGPDTLLEQLTNISAEALDGTINSSRTKNKSAGLSLELSTRSKISSIMHHFTLGMGVDIAEIDFSSDTEFAILDNDTKNDARGVTGIGLQDSASRVRLTTDVLHSHAFALDTFNLKNDVSLNVGFRANYSQIELNDLIESGSGSLNGDHSFSSFNPTLGLIYQASENVNFNLNYAHSSRVPTPAELSCADEDDPCKLPNGFVADPPLEQVIVKNISFSANYEKDYFKTSVNVYSSRNKDDIIFQQAGDRPSVGYFVNIDKTLRQGFELSTMYTAKRWWFNASYSYLKATFESEFTSFSPHNPMGGNRQVEKGDSIPGQPKHHLKFVSEYSLSEQFTLGGAFRYSSGQYFRGDEANENRMLGGYSVTDLFLIYQIKEKLSISLRVDNIFDKKYQTFGTYAEADEVLENIYPNISSPEFVGVAAPRMWSLSMRYQF